MKNIAVIKENLSLTEIAVRASYQVVITDKCNIPVDMGAGCILFYKKRLFFLTVAHLVDQKRELSVSIETNKDAIDNQTPTYCVGALNFMDVYKISDMEEFKKSSFYNNQNLKRLETIDFAFAEVFEVIEVLQKELDFAHHGKVRRGTKIIIPENTLTTLPDSNEPIIFYGSIEVDFENGVLSRRPKLTIDCRYISDYDKFYKLRLPKTIDNETEFKGISGAPIFDTKFNFLGLISHGFVGESFIYAFKNTEIKSILDQYITINPK